MEKKFIARHLKLKFILQKIKTSFKKAEGGNSFVGLRKEFLFQHFSSENKWVKIRGVFRTYSNM